MSSKTLNIFSKSFDTYADALYNYLENKGIEKVWLAERITPPGQKVPSTQEKLSRWKREGSKPAKKTRTKINRILSVEISQNVDGKWEVSRTNNGKPSDEQPIAKEEGARYQLQQLRDLLTQDKVQKPAEDDPVQALEFAELLIRYAKEILKKESSD